MYNLILYGILLLVERARRGPVAGSLVRHATRGPEFHTKSPPWPENHTKTADPENHTTHAENGLEITLDSLENALILNKNTERTVGVVLLHRLVLVVPSYPS